MSKKKDKKDDDCLALSSAKNWSSQIGKLIIWLYIILFYFTNLKINNFQVRMTIHLLRIWFLKNEDIKFNRWFHNAINSNSKPNSFVLSLR